MTQNKWRLYDDRMYRIEKDQMSHLSHSHDHSHCHSHNHSHGHDDHDDDDNYEMMDADEENDVETDVEEIKHFKEVVDAFFNYKEYSSDWVEHMLEYYNEKLTDKQKSLLPNYLNKLNALKQASIGNSNFLMKVGQECNQVFMLDKSTSPIPQLEEQSLINSIPNPRQIDKVKSTLRQFAREWSLEGKRERDLTFLPILEELERLYPQKESRASIRVYCPVINIVEIVVDRSIEFNVLRDIDQVCIQTHYTVKNIKIPDVLPSEMIPRDENIEFSMVAGDFTKSIEENHWDSVCTCFFIDTARNIVEYIECISKMLKVGGYWINFGPLLYHYADHKDSIELSYEQLRHVITNSGFEILSESLRETEYTSNKTSLMKVVYKCQFFVAVKS
ncbi:N2227-like domain-containing protein [Heterostelium album PN500]|uniref:carnosine N-methyltransferase n=1 Tax=Heterostelium pallidum (strain ATCC 26659 / Pp 5 / PN500) TaxID=670386 RepID=D3BHF9_HETP5|nr:N2227-like domain-containing protein [Heterostelium album PN500]EFA79136.1 N2227-like domain-containing protein [Heterostelium album PN500]|eukprot:XP_020431258.1 N2227-like domain-containing protein [Heterostelium album PN500]